MSDEKLDKIIELLQSVHRWIKIDVMDKARKIIDDEFSDPIKILVYNLSDGRSSDDIEKIMKNQPSGVTIRNWWKRWALIGFMELHPNYKKRYSKLFNLEEFGVEIPEIPKVVTHAAEIPQSPQVTPQDEEQDDKEITQNAGE